MYSEVCMLIYTYISKLGNDQSLSYKSDSSVIITQPRK